MRLRNDRKRVVAPGVGRLVEVVRCFDKLHSFIDDTIAAGVEDTPDPLSCKLGCNACCRQVVSVSVLEMIYLLHGFGSDPFRMRMLDKVWPKIAAQMLLLHKGKTLEDLKEGGTTCVFLHEERCLVYAWRPCVCRARTSFDDPNQCAIEDAEIRHLDVEAIGEKFQKVLKDVGRELRISSAAMPLPVALTFARAGFQDGLYELRKSLKWAPTDK